MTKTSAAWLELQSAATSGWCCCMLTVEVYHGQSSVPAPQGDGIVNKLQRQPWGNCEASHVSSIHQADIADA